MKYNILLSLTFLTFSTVTGRSDDNGGKGNHDDDDDDDDATLFDMRLSCAYKCMPNKGYNYSCVS